MSQYTAITEEIILIMSSETDSTAMEPERGLCNFQYGDLDSVTVRADSLFGQEHWDGIHATTLSNDLGRTLTTGRGKVQIEASLACSATKSNIII